MNIQLLDPIFQYKEQSMTQFNFNPRGGGEGILRCEEDFPSRLWSENVAHKEHF